MIYIIYIYDIKYIYINYLPPVLIYLPPFFNHLNLTLKSSAQVKIKLFS